jgi:hypothetical protein
LERNCFNLTLEDKIEQIWWLSLTSEAASATVQNFKTGWL